MHLLAKNFVFGFSIPSMENPNELSGQPNNCSNTLTYCPNGQETLNNPHTFEMILLNSDILVCLGITQVVQLSSLDETMGCWGG